MHASPPSSTNQSIAHSGLCISQCTSNRLARVNGIQGFLLCTVRFGRPAAPFKFGIPLFWAGPGCLRAGANCNCFAALSVNLVGFGVSSLMLLPPTGCFGQVTARTMHAQLPFKWRGGCLSPVAWAVNVLRFSSAHMWGESVSNQTQHHRWLIAASTNLCESHLGVYIALLRVLSGFCYAVPYLRAILPPGCYNR